MIVIVDYGVGNLGSIANMIRRIGSTAQISADHEVISAADKLILPGVGAFGRGMSNLNERGLIPVLERRVRQDGVPLLGLCLGMQLLTLGSEEGNAQGLGWIDANTVRFRVDETRMKVPHMGWNTMRTVRPHPLLDGLEPDSRFYFVHSYHVSLPADSDDGLGISTYGQDFASAIGRHNVMGVQFHPEKSHRFGMALLRNFVERF